MKMLRKRLTALCLLLAVLLTVLPTTGAAKQEQAEVKAKLPTPQAYYTEGYLAGLVPNEMYVATYLDASYAMYSDRFGRARLDISEPCTVTLFRVGGIDTESSDEQVLQITEVAEVILDPYYYVLDVGQTVTVNLGFELSSLDHRKMTAEDPTIVHADPVGHYLIWPTLTGLKPGTTAFTYFCNSEFATGYAYVREQKPTGYLYNSTIRGLADGVYEVRVGNVTKNVTVLGGSAVDLYDELEEMVYPVDIIIRKLHEEELCCSEEQWISIENEPVVTLDQRKLVLQVGETAQLSAALTNVSDYAIAWRSWDTDVLSVDDNGLVTALAIGKTEVSASFGPWFDMCDVQVVADTPKASLQNGNLVGLVANAVYDLTIGTQTVRAAADAQGVLVMDTVFPDAEPPYTLYVTRVYEDDESCSSIPQELQMYALCYNANGGAQAPAASGFAPGESVSVSMEQPVREDYAFLGWSEDPTDTEPQYLGGETLTLTETVTLYAVWEHLPKTVLQAGSADVLAGESVKIPITITQNPGIGMLDLTITYDSSVMTLTEIKQGEILSGGSFSANLSTGNVSWYDFSAATGDGTLAELTFLVKEDCAEGTYAVGVGLTNGNAANLADANFAPVDARFLGGSIQVASCIPGDLTGDRLVAADDAVLLTQAIANAVTLTSKQQAAADLNADGSVTVLDAVQMAGLLTKEPEKVSSDFGSGDVEISVDQINAVAGQTVTVPVRIRGNEGLAGFALTVVYDKNALSLTQITKGELLNAGTFLPNTDTGCVTFSNKSEITGDGTLMYLTFATAADAPQTACPVTVLLREDLPNNLSDAELQPIAVNFTPGAVHVGKAALQNAVVSENTLSCDVTMESGAGVLMVALYQNGRMVHVQMQPVTAGTKTVSLTYTGSYDSCKVFLLGGGMVPISGCAAAALQ